MLILLSRWQVMQSGLTSLFIMYFSYHNLWVYTSILANHKIYSLDMNSWAGLNRPVNRLIFCSINQLKLTSQLLVQLTSYLTN
jgi:hypothetical protein